MTSSTNDIDPHHNHASHGSCIFVVHMPESKSAHAKNSLEVGFANCAVVARERERNKFTSIEV